MNYIRGFLVYIFYIFCIIVFSGCSINSNAKFFKVLESESIPRLNAYATTTELAENVAPAIVGINSVSGTSSSVGSGVCVKSGGYILTNYHVISNKGSITLHLSNNTCAQALLIYTDENMDIAILKADKAIPYLAMGDSDKVCVGDDVVAVGTPISLTFKHSFTKGIISAIDRTLQVTNANNEMGIMHNLIQHDASINPGNSGGPLINAAGEVIGINTLKISSAEGMGFAIPIKAVQSIIENDNLTKKINYTTPKVGVYGYDAELEQYDKTGFYVNQVLENSPADIAELKTGDIITKFNGNIIYDAIDFRYELNKYECSDYVILDYVRNGDCRRAVVKFS